ncbi:MAG TPA: TetR/AcrR family transcriptional regulator [Acidimicrobiales bacterium]|nr:TetR/AcrR family transcriptional regulator [Acidimicrobiales bacterium]
MATSGAAAGTRRRPGRVALMRTAVGLMAEHGYDGTSTRDIAAAAGVTVAALYYHFPSKLDLLREFLQEAHEVVALRLARAVHGAADRSARERLDVAVATLVWSNAHDAWARHASQVAWREHGRLDRRDQLAIGQTIAEMLAAVEEIVADGVRAGEFHTDEPNEVARAIVRLCSTVVDPFPEPSRGSGSSRRRWTAARVDDLIGQQQRFAAALADTPPRG